MKIVPALEAPPILVVPYNRPSDASSSPAWGYEPLLDPLNVKIVLLTPAHSAKDGSKPSPAADGRAVKTPVASLDGTTFWLTTAWNAEIDDDL